MSKFLVVWDMMGLESVIDITEWEHESEELLLTMIQTGQSAQSKYGPILSSLLLRARFNSHRHYEIYAVAATDGINREDITNMFEQNPQGSADTIRRLGVKVYSDRGKKDLVKIT